MILMHLRIQLINLLFTRSRNTTTGRGSRIQKDGSCGASSDATAMVAIGSVMLLLLLLQVTAMYDAATTAAAIRKSIAVGSRGGGDTGASMNMCHRGGSAIILAIVERTIGAAIAKRALAESDALQAVIIAVGAAAVATAAV